MLLQHRRVAVLHDTASAYRRTYTNTVIAYAHVGMRARTHTLSLPFAQTKKQIDPLHRRGRVSFF